jgi:hypothetical protein
VGHVRHDYARRSCDALNAVHRFTRNQAFRLVARSSAPSALGQNVGVHYLFPEVDWLPSAKDFQTQISANLLDLSDQLDPFRSRGLPRQLRLQKLRMAVSLSRRPTTPLPSASHLAVPLPGCENRLWEQRRFKSNVRVLFQPPRVHRFLDCFGGGLTRLNSRPAQLRRFLDCRYGPTSTVPHF